MHNKYVYLIFTCFLSNFIPCIALGQTPSFEDLDKNNDGMIEPTEYDQLIEEEKKEEENSLGLSKYISLGQSFIDTANIRSLSCTSLNTCGETDPAEFSYTVTEGEDVFGVNAAIAFKALDQRFGIGEGASRYTNLIADPVIEANVSSADSTDGNFVRVAVPLIFSFNDTSTLFPATRKRFKIPEREPSFFSQHNLIVVPKYEADQGFDTQTIGLDLLYTPTIPDIGIGSALRQGTFGFRWLPVFGFEFGNVIENSADLSTLPTDTFARTTARLRAEFGIINDLAFSADYVFNLDLTGEQDINDFVDLTLQYFLDEQKHISVGLEYANGGRAPTFKDAESLRSFFGLRF